MTSVWTPPRDRHELSEHEADRPTWLELFYDLVFVAVFIQIGDRLGAEVTWTGVGRVLVLFAPLWWVWAHFAWYMNRFAVDDVLHRVLVLVQVFFVAWMGASVGDAFGDLSTQFVLCWVGFRATLVVLYVRTGPHLPHARDLIRLYVVRFQVVAIVVWLASLALPPTDRWVAWIAALLWEVWSTHARSTRALHERFPVHVGHLRERFGTLIIIVLGETFIKTITSAPSIRLTVDGALFAVPGLATLFALWWLYFALVQGEEASEETLGILRPHEPMAWVYTHLPLGLVLIGYGVAKTKLFESIEADHLAGPYVALYLGSLAAFVVLVSAIARDRSVGATGGRLLVAAMLVAVVPIAVTAAWDAAAIGIVAAVILVGHIGLGARRTSQPTTHGADHG